MNGITEENSYREANMERISTGVPGLDLIIAGGLPKNSTTLLSGPPGGGKSIFCFQFIYDGAKKGEKCLFLTLDKKVEGLLAQARQLGFDFQPAIESNQVKFLYLNISKKFVYESMTNEILSGEYDRIIRIQVEFNWLGDANGWCYLRPVLLNNDTTTTSPSSSYLITSTKEFESYLKNVWGLGYVNYYPTTSTYSNSMCNLDVTNGEFTIRLYATDIPNTVFSDDLLKVAYVRVKFYYLPLSSL